MVKLRVAEAMTRFECNLRGCCCKEWRIPFQVGDLRRLLEPMTEAEQDEVTRGLTIVVDEEKNVRTVRLRTVGDESACQFLAEDGRCGLQLQRGIEVLPHICRAFPGYGVKMGDQLDLCFNLECPEVLNQLDESDGPYDLIELDIDLAADPYHHLGDRARFGGVCPSIRFGERELAVDEFLAVQRVILDTLNRRESSVLESLAGIFYALARLAKGQPVVDFAIRRDQPLGPFDRFFESCVAAHQPRFLAEELRKATRFVFDVDLADADYESLPGLLEYRADWWNQFDPDTPHLQPLMFRYLAHRFLSPFSSSPLKQALSFAYGTIVHCLATAFRYAASIGPWLPVTDDRLLLKLSLGFSETVYGKFRGAPTNVMPWFEP